MHIYIYTTIIQWITISQIPIPIFLTLTNIFSVASNREAGLAVAKQAALGSRNQAWSGRLASRVLRIERQPSGDDDLIWFNMMYYMFYIIWFSGISWDFMRFSWLSSIASLLDLWQFMVDISTVFVGVEHGRATYSCGGTTICPKLGGFRYKYRCRNHQ